MEERQRGEATDDPLLKWAHWVDRAIEVAQERGVFDGLPGHGKPLVIEEHPYAGDRALGFHVLNNAGIRPLWMEIDRELQALHAKMQRVLDRLDTDLAAIGVTPPGAQSPQTGWFRRLLPSKPAGDAPKDSRGVREQTTAQARRNYLQLAAEYDEHIRLYNHALPPELRHLDRIRFSAEAAAREFERLLNRP